MCARCGASRPAARPRSCRPRRLRPGRSRDAHVRHSLTTGQRRQTDFASAICSRAGPLVPRGRTARGPRRGRANGDASPSQTPPVACDRVRDARSSISMDLHSHRLARRWWLVIEALAVAAAGASVHLIDTPHGKAAAGHYARVPCNTQAQSEYWRPAGQATSGTRLRGQPADTSAPGARVPPSVSSQDGTSPPRRSGGATRVGTSCT